MATSLTTVLIGTWSTLGECCSVCSHARARRAPRVLGVAPTQLSTANGDGSSPACDSEGQRRCWPTRPGRQSSSILDSDHRRPGDCLCVPYTKEPVRVCADGPFRFPCYLPTTSLLNTFPPCPPCPEGHRRTPRRPSPRGFPRSRLRSSAGATRWSRRSGAPCARPWSGR